MIAKYKTGALYPLLIALLINGLPGIAMTAEPDIPPASKIDSTEVTVDGVLVTAALTETRLEQTPQWDGLTAIPLPLENAISLAEIVASRFADGTSIKLTTVELKRSNLSDHWFYAVTFSRSSSPQNGRLLPFRIIVLFDRSVVTPAS